MAQSGIKGSQFMKTNGFLILFSLVFFISNISSGESSSLAALTTVKGFQEWKTEKIQAVILQANNVRMQINKAHLDGNYKLKESLERQLQQLKWNSEVARDLTVTDYFSLYLSQQPQTDRFQQAATKLSVQEVAELMEAYSGVLGIKKPDAQLVQATSIDPRKPGIVQIQAAQQK